ncbi:MAG: non-homologous end joining protein Ku [Fimbriimonadales bacterium]|nr:MAG: non-homologous end joining protein Ku [Fimbriimonadales bacterium]
MSGFKMNLVFGLVNIPVRYKTLTRSIKPVSARLLCPQHHEIVNQRYVCSVGTEQEHLLERSELVKGYPHPDDPTRLVVVDPDVIDTLTEERTGTAEIQCVIDPALIDPAYFEKTILLWAEAGAERAFDLFANALRMEQRAALVTTVLSKQTRQLVLRFSETFGTVLGHVCYFTSMIRTEDVEKAKGSVAATPPTAKELEIARTLMRTLEGTFDPQDVADTYTPLLQQAIRDAADGKKAKKAVAKKTRHEAELLQALMASLEEVKGTRKRTKERR